MGTAPLSCQPLPCCANGGGVGALEVKQLGVDDGAVEKDRVPDLVLPASTREDGPQKVGRASIKKEFKLKNIIMKAGAIKCDQNERLAFAVLCCDDGHDDVQNVHLETDETMRIWTVCPGVTEAELHSGKLSDVSAQSIKDTVDRARAEAVEMGLEISGVTGDRPLWLKHQPRIRTIIDDPRISVYMSTLIQLPMVSAAFNTWEKIIIVTFQKASEFNSWKGDVLQAGGISVDNLDRLIVMGATDLGGEWANFRVGKTTPEQEEILGKQLLDAVKAKLAEENPYGERHPLVKGILLSPKISPFSSLLRKGTGMPVFDELTLLKFFGGAFKLSRYSEANRLKNLKKKLNGEGFQGKIADRAREHLPSIGLIRLEYEYPPAPGDMDHELTFDFPIIKRTVQGLKFEVAQAGSMDEDVLDNMAAAIKELEEKEGVMGITGNCGFMMFYQCFARFVSKTPVFMSSLVQAQSVAAGLDAEHKVLVLTANSESLAPGKDRMLRHSGIMISDPAKFVIEGLQDLDGFEAVANAERVDTIKVSKSITERVLQIIEREKATGPIRTILLECTELPHYSDTLREATKLAVFDSVSVVNFFFSAVEKNVSLTKEQNAAYLAKLVTGSKKPGPGSGP